MRSRASPPTRSSSLVSEAAEAAAAAAAEAEAAAAAAAAAATADPQRHFERRFERHAWLRRRCLGAPA